MSVQIRSLAPFLWGTVATSGLLASRTAHKGRGLQNLFIQMKNAVKCEIDLLGERYQQQATSNQQRATSLT
jgi:hypothetical protein